MAGSGRMMFGVLCAGVGILAALAAATQSGRGVLRSVVSAQAQPAAPAPAQPVASGALGRYPERVYVPNEKSNTVHVIDPATFKIIATYPTGAEPHHVTPSWDLTKLYVNNTQGNTLTVIDPMTGTVTGEIPVLDPYNLYFTPDGSKAVVVAERYRRLDFRDPQTWKLIKSVRVPQAGVNHLAFSRGGTYLVASTEYSGWLVKVDLAKLEVVASMDVGGFPIDVVRPPGQMLMFVANQAKHGVHVVDPEAWKELEFIPTGRGAHGILFSHDRKSLYVSNRLGGSISVLDIATRKVVAEWKTGGNPDMGQLTPDGRHFWISSRYSNEVYVIDITDGRVIKRIPTDKQPHGLTYFPTSRFAHSLGHNGIYLED